MVIFHHTITGRDERCHLDSMKSAYTQNQWHIVPTNDIYLHRGQFGSSESGWLLAVGWRDDEFEINKDECGGVLKHIFVFSGY